MVVTVVERGEGVQEEEVMEEGGRKDQVAAEEAEMAMEEGVMAVEELEVEELAVVVTGVVELEVEELEVVELEGVEEVVMALVSQAPEVLADYLAVAV